MGVYRQAVNVPEVQVLAPDLEAIQRTGLHESGRWCAWRAEPNPKSPGKVKKYPSNGAGGLSTTEPDKWLSFDHATRLYEAGRFDGIGFLMGSIPGFVGIDLDGALSAGEVIEEKRTLVTDLESLGCYVEISPSGRGLRAFMFGQVPAGYCSNNGHGVEVYDGAEPRFLTVTGRVWGDESRGLYGNQGALESFVHAWCKPNSKAESDTAEGPDFPHVERSDDDVLTLLVAERFDCDGRYLAIYSGEIPAQSEERWEVLKQIAYFTRDEDQIERLMRRSKVDPSRFDERRGKYGTRLRYEIARVLCDQRRNYDADKVSKSQEDATGTGLPSEVSGSDADADNLKAKGRRTRKVDVPTLANRLISDPRLLGVVWFDEFGGRVTKSIPFSQAFGDRCAPKTAGLLEDDDLLSVADWVSREYGFSCDNPNVLRGAVRRWARAVQINPIAERLDALASEWDGKARVESWLVDYMGATHGGNELLEHYLREVGKRFLIAVVARALKPATQMDQMLVLEAPGGGEGKTAACRILAHAISDDAFLEGFSPSNDKDTMILLRGKVLAEWGELCGWDKRESEWIKSFLTRCKDSYRDPFGSFAKDWPRTVSFIATTNQTTYIRELEGKRRYWPVQVGKIDLDALRRDVGQLWGEAVTLYRSGVRFWIDPMSPADARFRAACDAEQRGRLVATAYDDITLDIANRLVVGGIKVPELNRPAQFDWVFSVAQMQRLVFPGTDHSTGVREWGAVSAALKRTGWESVKCSGGSRGWRLSTSKAIELAALNDVELPSGLTPKQVRTLRAEIKGVATNGADCK